MQETPLSEMEERLMNSSFNDVFVANRPLRHRIQSYVSGVDHIVSFLTEFFFCSTHGKRVRTHSGDKQLKLTDW